MAEGLAGAGRQDRARRSLRSAKLLKGGQGRTFYAVGGTWRNLARLHMEMTNYPLRRDASLRDRRRRARCSFLKQVAHGDIEKIKGIEGVSKNRRSLLPYGAIVLQEIIAAMQPSKIVVLGARRARRLSLFAAATRPSSRPIR